MNFSDRQDAIDMYIDGLLDAADRERFERMMAADADLAATVRQQRRIDDSLRRSIRVPAVAPVIAPIDDDSSASTAVKYVPVASPARPAWRRGLALAAAFAMLGVGLKLIWSEYAPAPKIVLARPTFDQIYNQQVASGFHPYWTCDSDQQFVDTFCTRLGQPLLAHAPAGATTWGLVYTPAITPLSTLVLADWRGTKTIVVVDRDDKAEPLKVSPDSKIHVFNRHLGRLMLYELTPAATPALLSLFTQPAVPSSQQSCH